ncbi:Gfo/Idh/MocA family oxidoreductase [Botrimarina sp.]|uniref:Gfo/Idh/MocA family protein n=1 Tax=Botrimarina sp. TaxID=2795802 RepID=UPI0032ED0F3B
MSELRFVVIGAGFWSRFQLAGWGEIEGVRCVGVQSRTRGKAEALAERFGGLAVYDDAQQMIDREKPDFVDIITDGASHPALTALAAESGVAVICQKPLADTLAEAARMVDACEAAGVPLLVHENWRWQSPQRALKGIIASGRIGEVFRARIQYSNSFPVFENQPLLARLPRFILNDVGPHLLDAARFLFGEAESLYCQTRRVHPEIAGEDVATVVMGMGGGATVTCEMSYATRLREERFPQTFVLVEGSLGSAELGPDYRIDVTTADGVRTEHHPPAKHDWADPAYEVVHSSIVPCLQNLVDGLRQPGRAETTGQDNLKTLRLVEAAYQSAERGVAIDPRQLSAD